MPNIAVGKIVTLLIIALTLLVVVFTDYSKNGRTIVYDCGMAEWHPDIPKEVKEECRKLRMEELRKKQDPNNPQIYKT